MNGRITAAGGGPGVRQGGELALGVEGAFPERGGVFGRVIPSQGLSFSRIMSQVMVLSRKKQTFNKLNHMLNQCLP